MAYKAPKGTRDVLPEESFRWQQLEALIRDVVRKYGLREARTPVIEHTELFLRGVGSTTDIVQKEMYTFQDKGDRSITLKPEGTAGIVRLFVEHNLFGEPQPTKMYYLNNPVFRYERPQAGRLREHHQFGVEIFGASQASADAECISIVLEILDRIGLTGLSVRLNSIGCPNCRPRYHEALREYLHSRYDDLCETCKTRYEANPLRILDCKVPKCGEIVAQAPNIMDFICDDCRKHMDALLKRLDRMGIRYELTPTLVRGLDYYTKTVFEVFSDRIGSQGAICGGGRYDGLVQELCGPACPGVGFGMGMERLLLLMQESGVDFDRPARCDLYIAPLGEAAGVEAFVLAQELRGSGLSVDLDHIGRSMKAQFKYADKLDARFVLTVGDSELETGSAKLKRMSDGMEIRVALTAEAVQKAVAEL